jgi:hypothetical protein
MSLTGGTFTYEIKESIILDGETRNIVTTNSISNIKYMDQRTMLIKGSSGPDLENAQYDTGIQPIMKFNDYESAGTYSASNVAYIRITQKSGNKLRIRLIGADTSTHDLSLTTDKTIILSNTDIKSNAAWTVSCDFPIGRFNFSTLEGIYGQVFGDDPLDYPALDTGNDCAPFNPAKKYTAIQDAEIEFVVVTTY